MATVSDGQNPGRKGTPQRQSPAPKRQGRGNGLDPTVQEGQLPSEIFGFSQSYHTGAPGTQGASGPDADVTIQAGQLQEGLSGVSDGEITDTGAPGTQGHTPGGGGGTTVRYTDPFGYMGNDHRDSHASGAIDGSGDWTTMGDDSGFSGPTFPVLEGNRPTSTGIGQGSVSHSARNPNAGK